MTQGMKRALIPYAGAERPRNPPQLHKPEPMTLERMLLRELTDIAMRLHKMESQRSVLEARLRQLRASR